MHFNRLAMVLTCFSLPCKGTTSLINKPLYGCALLLNLNPNDGIIVVALNSKAEIGSPKYRILSGDVSVSDVVLLEKSDDIFKTYIST